MGIPKRNISEIKTRYELEPDLSDIYLEGTFDKEIFDAALKVAPEYFRPCYAIDDIEVDADVLAGYELTTGNRQRVIALANELDLPDTCVRLVVDRDFEDWLPTLPNTNGLVPTKYCDVEAVFFDEDFVKQVMLDASRCKISEWDKFFEALKSRLCELFFLRLEIVSSQMDSGLIDFTRCMRLVNGIPELNLPDLVERSLSGCSTKNDREAIVLRVEKRIFNLSNKSHQLVSRGHDFLKLVAWCVRATKGLKAFQSEESIARLLVLFAGSKKDDLLHPIW